MNWKKEDVELLNLANDLIKSMTAKYNAMMKIEVSRILKESNQHGQVPDKRIAEYFLKGGVEEFDKGRCLAMDISLKKRSVSSGPYAALADKIVEAVSILPTENACVSKSF